MLKIRGVLLKLLPLVVCFYEWCITAHIFLFACPVAESDRTVVMTGVQLVVLVDRAQVAVLLENFERECDTALA